MSTLRTVNIQHPSASSPSITLNSNGSMTGSFPSGNRNRIINGGFDLWQRGTSFTNPAGTTFLADRWISNFDGTAGTYTISRQSFTVGNPISGYEPTYFLRYARTALGSGNSVFALDQPIEDVRTFAGQTVTVSLWAKSDAARTISVQIYQNFGTGGSPSSEVYTSSTTFTLSTTWERYTATIAVPSISGKTLGTNNNHSVRLRIATPLVASHTTDFWGVQVEAGNVATRFEEETYETTLRKCQRYYQRINSSEVYAYVTNTGWAYQTTTVTAPFIQTVPFRTIPTSIEFSTLRAVNATTSYNVSNVTFSWKSPLNTWLDFAVSGVTTGTTYAISQNNSSSGYLALSAEL